MWQCGKSAIRMKKNQYLDFLIYAGLYSLISKPTAEQHIKQMQRTGMLMRFCTQMYQIKSFKPVFFFILFAGIHQMLLAALLLSLSSLFVRGFFNLIFLCAYDQCHCMLAVMPKLNARPLLSPLLSLSPSLCPATHTSNYRVCDGYYNTDLPG